MILNKIADKYTCVFLAVLVIVDFFDEYYCLCGDSFQRANAIVTIDGRDTNYIADECVKGLRIEKFQLLSHTESILPGTFSNLFHLHSIELNDAGIMNVDPGFLENTPSVKSIKIERNRLERIEKYTFDEIKLSVLDLRSNRISRIADYAFGNSNFEYLCLSDNRLDHINPDWFRNTTITALSMTHNLVTVLNDRTFEGIRGIKSLKLDYNKIYSIDLRTFSSLESLRRVFLSGNMLQDVDFEIKNSFVNLDVSFNNISALFLDDDVSLWILSIYPNPFECSCLRQLWKFLNKKKIQLWDSKNLKQPWKDEYPLCIVKYNTCNRENQNFFDVRREYFNTINYDVIGQTKYIKENDFFDLGIIE